MTTYSSPLINNTAATPSNHVPPAHHDAPPISTALQKGTATATTTLTVTVGDSVHDTSSLSGQTSNAGGTVTYKFYTNVTCTTGDSTVGRPVTVTKRVVPKYSDAAYNSAGTFYW